MKSSFSVAPPTRADFKRGKAHQAKTLAATPLDSNRSLLAQMSARGAAIMSHVSTETRLTGLLARVNAGLCNAANTIVSKTFLENALKAINSKESQDEIAGLVAASMGSDSDARAAKVALGKKVAVNVGHLIRAAGDWVQWYQYQTLAESEEAWLRDFVPQQINVRVANGDGTMATRDAIPNVESNHQVPLYFLLSDMFRAKLFDPQKGNIANTALATVDIALDVMEKLDALLQLPFTVGTPNSVFTAAFVIDNTTASHFHLSSRIHAGNLPAGNIIAPDSNGANTVPRFDVIRAIDEYYGRFGRNFDPAGVLAPAEIRVASGVAHEFGNEFTPTSVSNRYTDALFSDRGVVNFNGKDYVIVPDPTIDPDDPHVYVRGTLPGAIHFDKPAGALVHRQENTLQNDVETCERILVGQAFPNTWVPRQLAVRYRD